MNINRSGAKYSEIVEIGEKLKAYCQKTGNKILFLNRGIPSVVNIDLSKIVKLIDFNEKALQEYTPNLGTQELKDAINYAYFRNTSLPANICITPGGMNALDLTLQTLSIEKLFIPNFFWIGYYQVPIIRQFKYTTYQDFKWLFANAQGLRGSTIVINDPNNPTGAEAGDKLVMETITKLDANQCTVIIDCPYRRVFVEPEDDHFFEEMAKLKNVIIIESFSKSVGLSGQRIGFIHSSNKEFLTEFNLRSLYTNNGVNAFAQKLIYLLLTSEEGKKAAREFRTQTKIDMKLNIDYLYSKNLIATEYYQEKKPIGIFAILNKSEEELLKYNIGSVSMKSFCLSDFENQKKFSRINIAVKHTELKSFFDLVV